MFGEEAAEVVNEKEFNAAVEKVKKARLDELESQKTLQKEMQEGLFEEGHADAFERQVARGAR